MTYLFGIPALVFLVVLGYGAITGRIRTSSCCTVADPRKDLRMRAAFQDDDLTDVPSGSQAPAEADRR